MGRGNLQWVLTRLPHCAAYKSYRHIPEIFTHAVYAHLLIFLAETNGAVSSLFREPILFRIPPPNQQWFETRWNNLSAIRRSCDPDPVISFEVLMPGHFDGDLMCIRHRRSGSGKAGWQRDSRYPGFGTAGEPLGQNPGFTQPDSCGTRRFTGISSLGAEAGRGSSPPDPSRSWRRGKPCGAAFQAPAACRQGAGGCRRVRRNPEPRTPGGLLEHEIGRC